MKDKGFVPSTRRGPTGIGHTLEKALQIEESNIAIPDIGGRVELKATRKNASSLITLFTFNRGVWQVPQRTVIETYGYVDQRNRRALYNTVYVGQQNSQGFRLTLDKETNKVLLLHQESNTLIAVWSVYTIVGKFISKLERAIFVLAETRTGENNIEEFHFDEAYLLQEPSPESFITAFEESLIAIDIRMHLKESGGVRNHGTGIRIFEKDIPQLYGQKRQLI